MLDENDVDQNARDTEKLALLNGGQRSSTEICV